METVLVNLNVTIPYYLWAFYYFLFSIGICYGHIREALNIRRGDACYDKCYPKDYIKPNKDGKFGGSNSLVMGEINKPNAPDLSNGLIGEAAPLTDVRQRTCFFQTEMRYSVRPHTEIISFIAAVPLTDCLPAD